MRHPPNASPSSARVLLPRIVSSERRQLNRFCTTLSLCGLPPCAPPSLRVCAGASGGAPCTSSLNGGRMRVAIPLCVQLCDPCGARYTASASMETDVCAPRGLDSCDAPSLFVQPSVWLLHADALCGDEVAVELSVTLEIYLLRLEPCSMRPTQPSCPPLPLYPPPIQPRW